MAKALAAAIGHFLTWVMQCIGHAGYCEAMKQFTRKQLSDLKTMATFIRVYCHARHDRASHVQADLPEDLGPAFRKGLPLCPDCAALLAHGIEKRRKCPLDPKPTCKACRIHCYSKEYRRRIREIMAFSGRRMILRGRLDYLWHYLF